MEKWDYWTVTVVATALDAKLTEAGNQGWELVGFVPAKLVGQDWNQAGTFSSPSNYVSNEYRLVFKRRKQ